MNDKRKPHFIIGLWNYTVVSNFMTGLFALLPIILTFAVIAFVGSYLHGFLGPESIAGGLMKKFGAHFVTNEWVAYCLGGASVIFGIWLFGAIIKSEAKDVVMRIIDTIMSMPLVKSIYDPAKQAVQMVKNDNPDMKGMEVVFISFGTIHGAGMIGLRVSQKTFVFNEELYSMIYIPTSPVPMSGGILLVPKSSVKPIDVGPESMMQIYLTLGVVADKVLPPKYCRDATPEIDQEFIAEIERMK